MLSLQLKQYLIVGLFLITGYLLFLPQASLLGLFLFPVLPTLFILQIDDLIAYRRRRAGGVSHPVFIITDIFFIVLFCAELLHPCFFAESLHVRLATEDMLAAVLIYLGGRAYLYDTGLKWLAYGLTFTGVIVALSLLFSCYGFYKNMLQEGFLPGELVSLRYLLMPNGLMINDWAGILLVFLPFSVYTLYHVPRRWKYVVLIGPWMISLAIIYTLSRGAILAWSLFILVTIIVAVWCGIVSWNRRRIWLFTGCAALFVLCLLPISGPFASLTVTDSNSVQMQSVVGRFDRWEQVLGLIREHPWTGIGNGNYGQESMIISNQTGAPYTGRVNNLVMQLALEKGIFGLVLYAILFVVLFCKTIRHVRTAVKSDKRNHAFVPVVLLTGLCVLLVREMTFTTLLQQPVCLYFTTLLILMLSFPDNPRRLSGYFMPVQQITLILALLLWFSAARPGQVRSGVSRYNGLAIKAIEQEGDQKTALQNAELAIAAEPHNPVLWNNKALFLAAFDHTLTDLSRYAAGYELPPPSETMREALILFETASSLQPREPLFFHNAGWARLALGDTLAGGGYLEQALRLAPYTPQYLISMGIYRERSGHLPEAVELYTRALVISPRLANTDFFHDFTQRHPIESMQLVTTACDQLRQQADQTGDYKSWAKWAALRLECGDTTHLAGTLAIVVKHYPNLNRAWLELGRIYESLDSSKADQYYRKSYLLDKWDPLAAYRLGRFYENNGNARRSAEYYKQAVNNRRYVIPEQTQRLSRIYSTLFWANGYYPLSLSEAINPHF